MFYFLYRKPILFEKKSGDSLVYLGQYIKGQSKDTSLKYKHQVEQEKVTGLLMKNSVCSKEFCFHRINIWIYEPNG